MNVRDLITQLEALAKTLGADAPALVFYRGKDGYALDDCACVVSNGMAVQINVGETPDGLWAEWLRLKARA